MPPFARVTAVDPLGDRTLRVTFSDGLVRELDFAGSLPGALAAIDHDDVFAGVMVEPVTGTVCWPCGIDFDPDVLHGDEVVAAASQPRVVRGYRLRPAD